MNKKDVIDFFDGLASNWDADLIRNNAKIGMILDYARIAEGVNVLDVACGTGVLFPDYLARNVKKITGIDISPAMIKVARSKFSDPRIELINADIEDVFCPAQFDCCMVYNAFPHFPDSARLIECLAGKLISGGRLTIAHGMSRAQINHHHSGYVGKVSVDLVDENELALLLSPYFNVDVAVSNNDIYVVSGIKK
jgi:Methylase involved in ubiquinone/menaquinone biosynthesis